MLNDNISKLIDERKQIYVIIYRACVSIAIIHQSCRGRDYLHWEYHMYKQSNNVVHLWDLQCKYKLRAWNREKVFYNISPGVVSVVVTVETQKKDYW